MFEQPSTGEEVLDDKASSIPNHVRVNVQKM